MFDLLSLLFVFFFFLFLIWLSSLRFIYVSFRLLVLLCRPHLIRYFLAHFLFVIFIIFTFSAHPYSFVSFSPPFNVYVKLLFSQIILIKLHLIKTTSFHLYNPKDFNHMCLFTYTSSSTPTPKLTYFYPVL